MEDGESFKLRSVGCAEEAEEEVFLAPTMESIEKPSLADLLSVAAPLLAAAEAATVWCRIEDDIVSVARVISTIELTKYSRHWNFLA